MPYLHLYDVLYSCIGYDPTIYRFTDLWGATSSSNLHRISKPSKRAARVILRAHYNQPSSAMLHELNWLPMDKQQVYNKALLTFKVLNTCNLTPECIINVLKPMSETHSCSLRLAVNGLLSVPRSRTSIFDKYLSCFGPEIVEFSSHLSVKFIIFKYLKTII